MPGSCHPALAIPWLDHSLRLVHFPSDMSLSQIEAELPRLSAEELRQIAVLSWSAFVEKEAADAQLNACNEDDPRLLARLDDAIRHADRPGQQDLAATEVRSWVQQWTTR